MFPVINDKVRKILIFEDLPTLPLERINQLVQSKGFKIFHFTCWSTFFELYKQEHSLLDDVSIILLDHCLEDNDTFNPDGRKRVEGYNSISFYNWLKLSHAQLCDKVIGISSERTYQTSLPRYEGKLAVLDLSRFSDLFIEFSTEIGEHQEEQLYHK